MLCLRKLAQAIPSWTTPACQMKAANTALMDSATLGLIASTTGPWGGRLGSLEAEEDI